MDDDDLLVCTDTEFVIRRSYSPLGSAKRIPYARIRSVRWVPLTPLTGGLRIWGSGDFVHWFPLDGSRPRKQVALIVDLGRRVKPVVTPADPERLADRLTAHGVEVRRGAPTH
jgi:hypothetical protein